MVALSKAQRTMLRAAEFGYDRFIGDPAWFAKTIRN